MAKYHFFGALGEAARWMDQKDIISSFNNRRFTVQTSFPTPTIAEVQGQELEQLRSSVSFRCAEAQLDTLSGFIECCVFADLPYKAVDTVARFSWPIEFVVHPVHQCRSAAAVRDFLNTAVDIPDRQALAQQILNLSVFSVYAPRDAPDYSYSSPYAWLDDPGARNTLKAALTAYLPTLLVTNKDEKLCSRVQKIITNLDALHPQQEDSAVTVDNASCSDDIQLTHQAAA
ncbi:hypothetical protein C8R47DRAFT_1136121 [Mycena vitilis]|nr:hypothetical protein C8R47DRAFT_1136121 [Mycena vitilis]